MFNNSIQLLNSVPSFYTILLNSQVAEDIIDLSSYLYRLRMDVNADTIILQYSAACHVRILWIAPTTEEIQTPAPILQEAEIPMLMLEKSISFRTSLSSLSKLFSKALHHTSTMRCLRFKTTNFWMLRRLGTASFIRCFIHLFIYCQLEMYRRYLNDDLSDK